MENFVLSGRISIFKPFSYKP